MYVCVCVAVCDDITRGAAEGKEVGRRTCLEFNGDKTETYLINYPVKTFLPQRKVKAGWLGSVLLPSRSFLLCQTAESRCSHIKFI